MNSPAPALTPTAVGTPLIVRLDPPPAATPIAATPIVIKPLAPASQAANDGNIAAAQAATASVSAQRSRPARVPVLIALAAGFWMLGTAILVTLALATRLVA